METTTMFWLVFMLCRWQLLLATGLGEPVVWLNSAAVVYPPLSPVRPHLILSHYVGPDSVTKPMQSLSEGHKSPSRGHQLLPGGWKQQ